jgi:PAS domain S-box-containing protein
VRADLRAGISIRRDLQSRWVRKDGGAIMMSLSVRWCALSQVTYATGRDVTAQHAVRAALDKSQQQLQVMLESIGDAFFAVDRSWRITYANRKAGAFVNADAGLSIGKNLLEVAPDLHGSRSLRYYQRAMETGEACAFETYWEPSGAWIEVRAYPSEEGLSVYFHDISFKREAEEALRKSEQRYRNLFQQAADSIVIADRDPFIVAANVKAVVDMAHARKLAVVAEGVETAEVVEFLRAAACDEAQGYHFARPLPLAALRERLAADAGSKAALAAPDQAGAAG